MAFNVDQEVSPALIKKIQALAYVRDVKLIKF